MAYKTKRAKDIYIPKEEKRKLFALPVEQAVFVPSTTSGDKPVSHKVFKKRIKEEQTYLSKEFGGYTSVRAEGGYYSTKKKKLIKEPVAVVESFATEKSAEDNQDKLIHHLSQKADEWGQESVGFESKGHLYYVPKGLKKH